ncbi:MAG: GAF domain-containing sensor histidine kinase, partial [Anaerolineae bacterium]
DNPFGFSYTNLMPLPSDFYALLSSLFHQMVLTPNAPPVIPQGQWPAGSQEQLLLEDFQTALAALQARNQECQSQMEAHMREQSTRLEISQTLASALALEPGLILDQLRVIVEYTYAVLFVLEDLTLVTLAVQGPQPLKEAVPSRIQLDGPESLAALLNGHAPQRIADVWSTDPAAQFLRMLLNKRAAVLLEGVRAWMWVPLAVKGRIIGGIGVAHAKPDSFTAHHADLALIVANQAAITLVNAQLYEQAQAVATLQERQRLAQNLHDAVNQSLFSASLIAEVLPRLWERNPDVGRQSLEDLRRLTRGAMAEMRSLLAELRPLVLTDSDLGDLLRQLGDALTGRTNIPVTVTLIGEGALPAEVQVALYRLCQEGLNNIAKHAKASQVAIDLEYGVSKLELHIRDNGCGFNPDNIIPAGHYGLSIMRERAKVIGAELSVTSQPDRGTDIHIRWLKPSEQETL